MVWKTKTVRGKGNETMTDGKVKTGAKHILLRKGVKDFREQSGRKRSIWKFYI